MRDHTKLRAFELADDVTPLVYRLLQVFQEKNNKTTGESAHIFILTTH